MCMHVCVYVNTLNDFKQLKKINRNVNVFKCSYIVTITSSISSAKIRIIEINTDLCHL